MEVDKEMLEREGYFHIVESPHGYIGLCLFIYTVGICVGLDEDVYLYRFCYKNMVEARGALNDWEAKGFEGEPEDYIKRK